MEYPVWHIVGLSTGLYIGLISVIHVFVAQFAVGGGIYLVRMEYKARAMRSPALLDWLQAHTRFFLLLTMVFGGLSGVAIWFTMSVASPAGTAFLAHNFLFFWASEWTFFLIEIVGLLVYYYTWQRCRDGRFSPQLHLRAGWLFAGAGFMSLFLINGIIAFMLTPGEAIARASLWQGFFNPTFWPSLVYRTALCLLIAGLFALLTAPRIADPAIRRQIMHESSLWICLPLCILLAASCWYFAALPPDRQEAVLRRTRDIRPFLITYGWMLPVVFLAGVLAFIRAERLRLPLALLILSSGLALAGSFEWIRETGRRPWVIPGYIYSNGITVAEGALADRKGVAALSGWAAMLAAEHPKYPGKDGVNRGALLFSLQCGACHGIGGPRIDIVPRLRRLAPAGIEAQLRGQGLRLDYMPPFFGDASDRAALAGFLNALRVAGESAGESK